MTDHPSPHNAPNPNYVVVIDRHLSLLRNCISMVENEDENDENGNNLEGGPRLEIFELCITVLHSLSISGDPTLKSLMAQRGTFEVLALLLSCLERINSRDYLKHSEGAREATAQDHPETKVTGDGEPNYEESMLLQQQRRLAKLQARVASVVWGMCVAHPQNKEKARPMIRGLIGLLHQQANNTLVIYHTGNSLLFSFFLLLLLFHLGKMLT